MLKMTTSLTPTHLVCIGTNANKLGTDYGSGINNSKIDNKIINPLSCRKKMSSKAGFLTPKASLAFIQ